MQGKMTENYAGSQRQEQIHRLIHIKIDTKNGGFDDINIVYIRVFVLHEK